MAKKIPKVEVAKVRLWGQMVGAVAWNENRNIAVFEYDDNFIKQGLNVAPLMMPLGNERYAFPELSRKTFQGLPGMLADTLPDKFGNRLIELWLEENGRSVNAFTPVERLCYMGKRGMGALEFQPYHGSQIGKSEPIEVAEMVKLANQILYHKGELSANFLKDKHEAIKSIIRIGTSAGGNRPKAVIAWNSKTGEVRSGQVEVPEGFEPWLLKFDGVEDEILGNTGGYGKVEYAYYKMAIDAGIKMNPCQLFEEGGRAHFMTKRFDRTESQEKIHMQSLCAMAHFDFNESGLHSYEEAFNVMVRLNLGHDDLQELYRRMLFNIMARNQDDHTRNIAFLMDKEGVWRLSPAFDLIWAYNPDGPFTFAHQMSVSGKRDNFTLDDLKKPAKTFGIKDALKIFEKVSASVSLWPKFAEEAGVDSQRMERIKKSHRKFSI